MGFDTKKNFTRLAVMLIAVVSVCLLAPRDSKAETITVEQNAVGFGVIKGVVRDKRGKPISRATVAVFRLGTSKLLKQVTASKTGKFFTKIIPGTYTVLAVAQGFNPVTLDEVKVSSSDELVYGFKLEKAGSGNTIPEKQADRKSARYAVRAARRSIYQANEGNSPVDEDAVAAVDEDDFELDEREPETLRRGSSVVETFVAANREGPVVGVNFATLMPVGEKSELLISGQTANGNGAGNRFETAISFSPKKDHRVKLRGSIAMLGDFAADQKREQLSQVSFQATDQWNVREGIILLLGVDYSRFLGVGNASSLTPRIGVQYDIDSKTRVRSAYTTRTEQRTWSKVIQLENSQVLFSDPVSVDDIAVHRDMPEMNRSTRFEIGVERVLDNRTNVEANAFLDTVRGRGVGIDRLPFGASNAFDGLVGRQEGGATGMRVVMNRRFNSVFSGSAGYAFGNGQKLSGQGFNDPAALFENGLFQSMFSRVSADFNSGTSVSTIFRFSPQATVFAIDPFEGRLAIYDPGLSVLVTQSLPSWGLPIDAEATLDARNLFDFSGGAVGHDGAVSLSSQRRVVRGSIMVRF